MAHKISILSWSNVDLGLPYTLVETIDCQRELEKDILDFVNRRLSPHEKPRLIEFVDQLPMTATGKIKRKDLRDAEIAQENKKQQD